MLLSFSIIIPIYNEEKILETQIKKLKKYLSSLPNTNYEILLIENGSSDNTYQKAKKLSEVEKNLSVYRLKLPCYGEAIKKGINKSKYNFIFQLDLDFFDKDFLIKSWRLLENYDIVVGSKLHKQSNDKRPFLRVLLTRFLYFFLKTFFSYKGTDTHGIKVYKKDKIKPILKTIATKHHFFESELMLRAYYNGLKIKELPVRINEIRPTRFPVMLRLNQAVKELFLLLKLRNGIIKKSNFSS